MYWTPYMKLIPVLIKQAGMLILLKCENKITVWKVDHIDEYNFLMCKDKPTLCTELQGNSLGTDQSNYNQMLSGKTSCQSVKWNEQMQLFSVRLRSVHWWFPSSNYWCWLYVYESLGLGNLQINNNNNFRIQKNTSIIGV